jgi:hypothetical protein
VRFITIAKSAVIPELTDHIILIFLCSGTCYSTRGAPVRPEISGPGELNSLTITTMHDAGNTFDENFVRNLIYGMSGLNSAVVEDEVTVQAAMATRSQSVSPGNHNRIEVVIKQFQDPQFTFAKLMS